MAVVVGSFACMLACTDNPYPSPPRSGKWVPFTPADGSFLAHFPCQEPAETIVEQGTTAAGFAFQLHTVGCPATGAGPQFVLQYWTDVTLPPQVRAKLADPALNRIVIEDMAADLAKKLRQRAYRTTDRQLLVPGGFVAHEVGGRAGRTGAVYRILLKLPRKYVLSVVNTQLASAEDITTFFDAFSAL